MPYDEEETEAGPKSSFDVYKAEGDILYKQQEFKKALGSYNEALELRPGDKNCLVARSKCYLQLGDSEASLRDAEQTLDDDRNYIQGLFQKAEALYQKGDFEFALVFYHRGHQLRPEVQGFRLGIQKAQEAIDNCIGDSAGLKLQNKGDLSYFYKVEEKKKVGKPTKGGPGGGTYRPGGMQQKDKKAKEKDRPKSSDKDNRTIKQLLGELYADREYLEKLLKDPDLTSRKTETSIAIRNLAIEGIEYLDTRTEFWQQQKPMYSRKRDKQMRERSNKGEGKRDPTQYILRNLEEIDQAQADGKYEDSLKQSKRTLKTVEKWSDDDVPNRPEVIANLYSFIGNAYLEMADYNKALDNHNKDYDIAVKNDLEEAKSRALDNLGRVYARMGKFEKAVEVWEDKLPLSKSALESTWLYHEIGRCYLELSKFNEARDYGEKSLKCAEEAKDDVWQLNASVLIAQSEVKLGDHQAALDCFEKSLEMAKVQNDKEAVNAIKKAIEDVNKRIVQGMQEGEGEDQEATPEQQETEQEETQQQAVEDTPQEESETTAE